MNVPPALGNRTAPCTRPRLVARLEDPELCLSRMQGERAVSSHPSHQLFLDLHLHVTTKRKLSLWIPFLSSLCSLTCLSRGLHGVARHICIPSRAPAPQLLGLHPTVLSVLALSFHVELSPCPSLLASPPLLSWSQRLTGITWRSFPPPPDTCAAVRVTVVPPPHPCLRGCGRGEGRGRGGWRGSRCV